MSRSLRYANRRWSWLVAASVLVASPTARADDDGKLRCRTAYERGQQLRRDGRLSASRVELRVCAETCPATLAPDCARWIAEVTAILPTVRFRVESTRGGVLDKVRVLVDGQLLGDPVPDHAIAVDPGERELRFEREGSAAVTVHVTLEPGERDRLVEVRLAPSALAPAVVAAPPALDPVVAGGGAASRAPSYALGITGLAALAVGGGLAIKGHVDRAHLESTCAPACDPSDVTPIRGLWWASAIVSGAGLVSVGLAVLLWPRVEPAPTRARAAIVPMLGGLGFRADLP